MNSRNRKSYKNIYINIFESVQNIDRIKPFDWNINYIMITIDIIIIIITIHTYTAISTSCYQLTLRKYQYNNVFLHSYAFSE